jgi:formylglycine-generating enzyme required for sulfatase activity
MLARAFLPFALLLCLGAADPAGNPFIEVSGGDFRSALPPAELVRVRTSLLQRHPVTNGEFLAFVTAQPQWRRGAVAVVLADAGYLGRWAGPLDPGPSAAASRPVTEVS